MSAFIAALPMYDWPETRDETDALWARFRDALRSAGIDAPEGLVRCNGDLPPVPGGIRDAEGTVIAPDPATLPADDLDVHVLWRHPALLLAQTCWGPMEQGLSAFVQVVGQPDYSDVEGGRGPLYSSVMLMRRVVDDHSQEGQRSVAPPSVLPDISPTRGEIFSRDDLRQSAMLEDEGRRNDQPISPPVGEMSGRTEGGAVEHGQKRHVPSPPDGSAFLPVDRLRGARFAFNGPDSMSGIIALTRDLAVLGEDVQTLFAKCLETGSHRASIRAVAEGRADACAVDCRSWDLALRHEPAAQNVIAVGWTARRPGLPLITARRTPEPIVAVLRKILAER